VRWTDIIVRHTGYVDPALRERKLQRDSKILEEELAERPDNPFVLFNLGSIAIERENWSTALGFLQRSLAGSAPTDSITRKLFVQIARCHQMLGELPIALSACTEGLSLDPDDAELLFRKGFLHRQMGQPAEAEASWRRIVGLKRPDQFSSLDEGIYGHLTYRNLAVLAEERGDRDEAMRLWERVLVERPEEPEAHAILSQLRQGVLRRPFSPWIVPGSTRMEIARGGAEDFAPYAATAARWVEALDARTIVELGVRFGASTRALLDGARVVDGHVWGVDPLERHDVVDPRFTYLPSDPLAEVGRWERIDLLHLDVDPHCEADARRWLDAYAERCRAIAIHDSHHPRHGLSALVAGMAASGVWQVFEYRGDAAGWTVLARLGEPSPNDGAAPDDPTRLEAPDGLAPTDDNQDEPESR